MKIFFSDQSFEEESNDEEENSEDEFQRIVIRFIYLIFFLIKKCFFPFFSSLFFFDNIIKENC